MRSDKGLYIHVPFCRKKCPYCDFYSVGFREEFSEKYADAVIRNIRHYGGRFDTVYFGGGTPILLYKEIPRILAEVDFEENAEITVECCPNEMNDKTLKTLRSAGVNRLSVGVQSLCDGELSALGRMHSAREAENAVLLAEKSGFDNISADLMLATPQQTAQTLKSTINRLCKLPITHVSAYLLKIEPNTVFGKNPPALPDEDETAGLYLLAIEELEKHGFHQYEISSFARGGKISRHNLKYWKRNEYLGIGPAAHSFWGGERFYVPRGLKEFLSAEIQETLSDGVPNALEEEIMLGLRLRDGIPRRLWERFSKALPLVPEKYYRISNGRLSLTAEGFLVSNEIISLLLSKLQ